MTSQKSFIFDYLKSVKSHPSAEVVYREVKKKLPNISQGTVYRVLNNFKAKGELFQLTLKTRFILMLIFQTMLILSARIVKMFMM